jgi:hypothetical protein
MPDDVDVDDEYEDPYWEPPFEPTLEAFIRYCRGEMNFNKLKELHLARNKGRNFLKTCPVGERDPESVEKLLNILVAEGVFCT